MHTNFQPDFMKGLDPCYLLFSDLSPPFTTSIYQKYIHFLRFSIFIHFLLIYPLISEFIKIEHSKRMN